MNERGRTLWHLPAVIRNGGNALTTACGKRGPIRVREDIGTYPISTSQPFLLAVEPERFECEKCAVAWDEAEQNGRIEPRYIHNGHRQWRGPGAYVAPLADLERYKHHLPKMLIALVMVRPRTAASASPAPRG